MDAKAIQAVLEAGRIGERPFGDLLEHYGKSLSLDPPGWLMPKWMGKPLSAWLSDLGVEAVRWEEGNSNPDEQRLWQKYLVLTLPETAFSPEPLLRLLHDVAVEALGSYYYCLKGRELWIEYLIARPHVRDAIEATLMAGKIGELPFPVWFRYNPASTSILMMSHSLAVRGVTEVRWETEEYKSGVTWQAYLVAVLPISIMVSPPSLPSERLISEIGMILRQPRGCSTDVIDDHVEVRASYEIKLPLGDPPGELVEKDGITFISFRTPKARKLRARQLRQELWRTTRALVKHYTRR